MASKISTLNSALKSAGFEGLSSYHIAKALINANRCKSVDDRRSRMTAVLRNTNCAAWHRATGIEICSGGKSVYMFSF
jgi:hypothetical protein